MNRLFFLALFLTALISCDKEPGSLEYSETIPGGCVLSKGGSFESTLASETNKVSYNVVNGNLILSVGFNATCCTQYSTTPEIKDDTIFIKIITIVPGDCYCICYYLYDFEFIGSGKNYKYNITVDDGLSFIGEINL